MIYGFKISITFLQNYPMQLKQNNASKFFKIIILLHIFIVIISCAELKNKPNESLRFAIISNTYGESPYSGLSPLIDAAIKQINGDNPVFLMHLGGIVCAGAEWHGISEIDINRQFREFYSSTARLMPILYAVKGCSDIYNNSSDLYNKYSGRKDYYSFNYGSLHFIVVDSAEISGSLSERQKNWIINDLEQSKDSRAIFVFIHNPLFAPTGYRATDYEVKLQNYIILHEYFKRYKVKAVFSGMETAFFKLNIDGIYYINAGCGGFNKIDFYKGYYQYYVVDYKNGELQVLPKYVTNKGATAKSY